MSQGPVATQPAAQPFNCATGPLQGGLFNYQCGAIPGESYLYPEDVRNFALNGRVTNAIGDDILWMKCISKSSEFRGYARKRYKLPLIAWGADLVEKLAFRVAYSALFQLGYNEQNNPQIKDGYAECGQFFKDVRDNKIDIDIIESQPAVGTPRATSLPLRGWAWDP
jgi:Protein of unknown function (DUF1320)